MSPPHPWEALPTQSCLFCTLVHTLVFGGRVVPVWAALLQLPDTEALFHTETCLTSHPLICSVLQPSQHGLVGICFVLRVTNCTLFCCPNCSHFGPQGSFGCFLCPSTEPISEPTLRFWHYDVPQAQVACSPPQSYFSVGLWLLHWKMVLEIKIWQWVCSLILGCLLLFHFSS